MLLPEPAGITGAPAPQYLQGRPQSSAPHTPPNACNCESDAAEPAEPAPGGVASCLAASAPPPPAEKPEMSKFDPAGACLGEGALWRTPQAGPHRQSGSAALEPT